MRRRVFATRLLRPALVSALVLAGAGNDLSGETADELRARAGAVLAQLEGKIAVPGLTASVEVLRDRWGVPHIYAKNQDDLFFAQGFVAAQDRLFQIDLWRRVAVGETAAVFGTNSIVRDRFARLTRYRGSLRREWAGYGPDTKRIVTAFTRGINACIDHLGDRLPIEFQLLGHRPKRWQPEDALGRMSVLPVAFNLDREVARAELVARSGLDQAQRLLPTEPRVDFDPVAGLDLAGIDEKVLAGYNAVIQGVRANPAEASNNWVVDGTRSVSGKPMLASDPHRSITLPSLRYLVHLNAPGWNVIGGGEPALPGVAIGHNERIAWGFTVVLTDQADLVVEETNPADPNQYRVNRRWEPMEILRETVEVRNAAPVEVELRFTRHGPVIHEDHGRHRAYALRWMGSEPGTAAYLCSLALDRARNWREFRNALEGWKAPSENFVYADVDGNIGWIAAALTPIRRGWRGLLPVPGVTGEYRWRGFLKLREYPQSYNPPDHFLITANHNILPPGYRHAISYDFVPDYRFRRIRGLLGTKARFVLEDFKRMQHDRVSLPARELAAILSQVDLGDPALAEHARQLREWDGTLSQDSAAGAIYGCWLHELNQAFFGPRVPSHLFKIVSERNGITVLIDALKRPDGEWFGREPEAGRNRLVRETFSRVIARLRKELGDDPQTWAWGRLHRVLFEHPLAGLGPSHAGAFNVGPFPTGGGPHTPDQAKFDDKFMRIHGPTYRQVFDLADWDIGQATSAPGQSGQPGSPHYADLAPLWERGEYFPLAFSRQKVEEVTRHRLMLRPAR
jgi:penicillin amidase